MANGEWTRKCHLCRIFVLFTLLGAGNAGPSTPNVEGYRIENVEYAGEFDGSSFAVRSDVETRLRLFGSGFTSQTSVSFTPQNGTRGTDCDDLRTTDTFQVEDYDHTSTSSLVDITLKSNQKEDATFFMCVKELDLDDDNLTTSTSWLHQGGDQHMIIRATFYTPPTTILPLWIQIILIVFLLACSGTFSGLNLGLMSLDKTELKIIENSGSPQEKKFAKVVGSVRRHGNYLLCTILLGNVLVNNTLTILLDDLSGSGPIAIISATLAIVIFGEIVPQAVCSRYGLAIGARTIWFTRFFMLLTFPLSFPISKILDCVLGEEIGATCNRDRLRELIHITQGESDLQKDEVNIIAGALMLTKKTVADIMTKVEDVYMIEYGAILDFETISEIMKTGYTRIPVYDKDPSNLVALLNIKDLAFVDPDDNSPLKTVCKFYNHPLHFVWEDTKLDEMLEEFKKGQCHLAFVRRVNNDGPGDPFYETLGVITLEDVIEEIIQCEIIDETDTVVDNRSRMKRKTHQHDFSVFNSAEADSKRCRISPQLTLATFQYLSTTVAPFKPELISENVLQKLLKQNVIELISTKELNTPAGYIYERGKTADFFCLVLQGRVEADIGREHMMFEAGPFMYFGIQALTGLPNNLTKQQSLTSISSASDSIYARQPQYIPDFSLKALENTQYLKIARSHYVAARRATLMERQPKTPDCDSVSGEDAFSKEWKRAISVNAAQVAGDNDSLHTSPASEFRPRTATVDSLDRSRAATVDSIIDVVRPQGHDGDANEVNIPLIDARTDTADVKIAGSPNRNGGPRTPPPTS